MGSCLALPRKDTQMAFQRDRVALRYLNDFNAALDTKRASEEAALLARRAAQNDFALLRCKAAALVQGINAGPAVAKRCFDAIGPADELVHSLGAGSDLGRIEAAK